MPHDATLDDLLGPSGPFTPEKRKNELEYHMRILHLPLSAKKIFLEHFLSKWSSAKVIKLNIAKKPAEIESSSTMRSRGLFLDKKNSLH